MDREAIGGAIEYQGRRLPFVWGSKDADGTLWVSGHLAFDEDMKIVGDTVQEQTRIVLQKLSAVFEAAGGTLSDGRQFTIYLERKEDFGGFNQAWAEFFDASNPDTLPSRATVVSGLIPENALVEISAVGKIEPTAE